MSKLTSEKVGTVSINGITLKLPNWINPNNNKKETRKEGLSSGVTEHLILSIELGK